MAMRITFGLMVLIVLLGYSCKNSADKHSDQQELIAVKPMDQTAVNQNDAFIINHTFETDKKSLFDMWIDPEIYTRWMGPTGAEMSFLNANVKEDGSAHWQMTTPDGLTKFGKLHYKTIHPSDQLVYVQNFCDKDGNFIKAPFSETYPDSLLLTVDFQEIETNKVMMTVKWETFDSALEIEKKTFQEMKPFMVQGWNESFEKIEDLLRKEEG